MSPMISPISNGTVARKQDVEEIVCTTNEGGSEGRGGWRLRLRPGKAGTEGLVIVGMRGSWPGGVAVAK